MRNLIKKILKEADEWDWVNKETPLNGVKVITPMGGELTIIDNGGKYVEVTWDVEDGPVIKGGKGSSTYNRKSVEAMIAHGTWRLNESEEDPFKWIRETQPLNYEYLLGKALHFQPLIINDGSLDRILNFLENLGFEVGDNLRYFDFEEEGLDLEGLYLNPKSNAVIYTTDLDYSGEDYEDHIRDYAERPVEVLDGWETLEGYI